MLTFWHQPNRPGAIFDKILNVLMVRPVIHSKDYDINLIFQTSKSNIRERWDEEGLNM